MVNMYVVLIDKINNKVLKKIECTKDNIEKIKYQLEVNLDLTKYEVKVIK